MSNRFDKYIKQVSEENTDLSFNKEAIAEEIFQYANFIDTEDFEAIVDQTLNDIKQLILQMANRQENTMRNR